MSKYSKVRHIGGNLLMYKRKYRDCIMITYPEYVDVLSGVINIDLLINCRLKNKEIFGFEFLLENKNVLSCKPKLFLFD